MTITLLGPDGLAITAQQFRQANAARNGGGAGRPLGGRSGFRVDTGSTVLSASSTTWTLTPCSAMIDPGATTHQGMYGWSSDANVTGSVTAADATYARKDIVYIQVNDSSAGDGSGATTAPVLYAAGTPSATPTAPALTARQFLVGTITVPQSGGGSPTVALNPARFATAGAPLPVYSQAERDALVDFDGSMIQRRDLPGRPIETTDTITWFRAPVVSSAYAVNDGYWTITGGLIKTIHQNVTQVTATLKMIRATGAITITTGDTALLNGLIPAGFRPPTNHYFIGTSNTNAGVRYAEPQLVIGDSSNGNLVGRSTSGGSVTIDTNYVLYISTSWFV